MRLGVCWQRSSACRSNEGYETTYVRNVILEMTATLPHFRRAGQFIGLRRSSGPAQSTVLESGIGGSGVTAVLLDEMLSRVPNSRSASFSSLELVGDVFSVSGTTFSFAGDVAGSGRVAVAFLDCDNDCTSGAEAAARSDCPCFLISGAIGDTTSGCVEGDHWAIVEDARSYLVELTARSEEVCALRYVKEFGSEASGTARS